MLLKLTWYPGMVGGLRGAGIAGSRQNRFKIKVQSFSIHEFAVDYVIHITFKVLHVHVNVQVNGQPVLVQAQGSRAS